MMSNIINKTFNFAVASITAKSEEFVDTSAFLQTITTAENISDHVCKFLDHLKHNFNNLPHDQQLKCLTVVIYCAHLATDDKVIQDNLLSLGAVITTFIEQSKDVHSKKIGYLALTALININASEIVYLAVNTILKDITSKYLGFITVSLDAVCQLVTIDLVPVLLPVVERRLSYKDAAVRIRALKALHCIHRVGPEFITNTKKHIKLALSDHNPEVMAAALPYLHDLVKNDPTSYADLPPVLVAILKQISQGRLPMYMSIHGIAAPFVQILILEVLVHLSLTDDTKAIFADVLLDMMNRCQSSKQNIAYGILAECVYITLRFYHNKEVIFNVAVESLGAFLNSSEANFLFMGISLLTQVAKIKPSLCVQYQSIVLKCLTHFDSTIKKQALLLLQVLINKENCKVICDHILAMLNTFKDEIFVKSLSENLSKIAEKFSSDLTWLLQILHKVIESSGDNVASSVCERLIEQVCKAESTQLSKEMEECWSLLSEDISFYHFEVMAFILSKFLKEFDRPVDEVIDRMITQSEKQLKHCNESRKEEVLFILISFAKQALCLHCSDDIVQKVVNASSPFIRNSPAIHQSLCELEILSKNKELLEILNDSSYEFDDDFSFLSQFEDEDLNEENETHVEDQPAEATTLKVQPYSTQNQPLIKTNTALMASMFTPTSPSVMGESFLSKKVSDQGLSVWGKEGYQRPQTTTNMTLNQALENLSTLTDNTEPDKAMIEMVNDVFNATSLNDEGSSNEKDKPL